MLSSRINVSDITFESGKFNIIVYPDSQTNLEKAIKKAKKEIIVQKNPIVADTTISKTKTVVKTKSDLSLQIDNLELVNLTINFENQLKKNRLQCRINEFQSDFSYIDDQIISTFNFDTQIDSLIIGDNLILADEEINFESELEIETDSIFVKLKEGIFSIGEAKL